MKEYQLRHSLGKAISFSFCAWVSVAGLFSCDSDRLNGGGSIGMLSLNLAADTTNIKGGTLSTKAGNILDGFEDADEYTVQIFQESDTLKSALYKDFPDELEMKEGAYTLRASKGENLPAAFDNPYFEGTVDFVIKKDMKTPLEVTCKMANARVYANYTEDFLKAYSDYSVSLKTSYMDGSFTITKGESRGAYLQVAKEGTPLSVAISLMRKNWKEPKVYTVTDPAITLNPKESVILNFATDGKTGDGLDLSIVLDDEMIETELVDSIPDFMWKPFEKPTLEAHGFTSGQTMQITKGGVKEAYIAFGVPAGIGGFSVYETVKGSTDTVKYELTVEGNVSELKKKGYDINVPTKSLLNYSGNGQLLLEKMLNQLECSETDKPYEFIFFAKDNLPNTNYTDTVRLFAEIYPAAPIVEFEGEFGSVVEGEAMKHDVIASIEAEGKIKDVVVTISTDTEKKGYHYSIASEWELLGCTLSKADDDTKATLTFPKTFTEGLDALANGDQTYMISVKVETGIGLEGNTSVEVSQPLAIKMPVFDWAMADNEGDVFAKRAILRARVSLGNVDKIKYVHSKGTLVNGRVKEGLIVIDTLKDLTPKESYTIQLIYDNGRNRKKTVSFKTEDAIQLTNGEMENWNEDWTKSLYSGAKVALWDKKYSVIANDPQGWSTVNDKTFGGNPNVKSTWNLRSSTVKALGKKDSGVLLRSVGWDDGSGNSFEVFGVTVIKHFSAGKLFLGNYSYDHNNDTEVYDYGISFTSRPSKVKFSYKYIPYGEDNSFKVRAVAEYRDGNSVICIGQSEYIGSKETDNYVDESFVIQYASEYLNLKATHFYLEFSSSSKYDDLGGSLTGNANDYLNKYFSHYNNSYKYFEGSNLYIDDVELIYE
ncbi:DUF4493 domain-containing protein [uncultured Parabacteroides sp.]|uniref:DUF4493 domain-containing protein n=1 Tax=uncultured Parabacteroides sp. TaxID=512312 RepID=UPI00262B2FA1|nr:DUF4493 domain-containing protein [uncultured Parabacteroides sp.]